MTVNGIVFAVGLLLFGYSIFATLSWRMWRKSSYEAHDRLYRAQNDRMLSRQLLLDDWKWPPSSY